MTVQRTALALAPNGEGIHDLFLRGDGSLAMVQDAEAVGQHVRQRLGMFEGEWFLDNTAGLPWFDYIFGKGYDAALAEAVVKTEILDTDGVTEITSFSIRFDQATRRIEAYRINVLTEYDEEVSL